MEFGIEVNAMGMGMGMGGFGLSLSSVHFFFLLLLQGRCFYYYYYYLVTTDRYRTVQENRQTDRQSFSLEEQGLLGLLDYLSKGFHV